VLRANRQFIIRQGGLSWLCVLFSLGESGCFCDFLLCYVKLWYVRSVVTLLSTNGR